jgi:hypothetical protein
MAKDVIIARSRGHAWYIGGVNGETVEKRKTIRFNFLPKGVKYKLTLITDGVHVKDSETKNMVVDKTSSLEIRMLSKGGFAALLTPMS